MSESEIPATMPYTFDEVKSCKEVSDTVLKRDWANLCKFKADTNPRTFAGNKIIYKWQLKNLLACRRGTKGYKTLEEWFATEELRNQLWAETVKRNRTDKIPYPCPTDVYECHRLNKGAICIFKSSTAKYVYKKFNATNVLDPTAGWGGRMLGASSLGIKYTGIDTNTEMVGAYDKFYEYGFADKDKHKMIWDSCFNVDFSKGEYDLVLTSPPYSNMEIYEHMSPWADDDTFYKKFMIPLLIKLSYEVKCPICINISPKMYEAITKSYGVRKCDEKVDLRQQLGKQFKTKSQDYIYIWHQNHIGNIVLTHINGNCIRKY